MSHRRSAAPRIVLAATVAVLVAAPAAAAAEQPPNPDETAAAAVYREFIPTAVGPRPALGPVSRPTEIPLSPAADAAISAVEPDEGSAVEPDESSVLEQVATSPRYGAPQRPLPAPSGAAEREPTLAVPAASDVVSTTTSGRILALGLVLLAVTGLLGGLAIRRRRGRVSADTSFG